MPEAPPSFDIISAFHSYLISCYKFPVFDIFVHGVREDALDRAFEKVCLRCVDRTCSPRENSTYHVQFSAI
jgi:hypothetical protein